MSVWMHDIIPQTQREDALFYIERSFADSKELHGLCYARMREKTSIEKEKRPKVGKQCLLTAAV